MKEAIEKFDGATIYLAGLTTKDHVPKYSIKEINQAKIETELKRSHDALHVLMELTELVRKS